MPQGREPWSFRLHAAQRPPFESLWRQFALEDLGADEEEDEDEQRDVDDDGLDEHEKRYTTCPSEPTARPNRRPCRTDGPTEPTAVPYMLRSARRLTVSGYLPGGAV